MSISEIMPVVILLTGAFLMFGGTELARRAKLPEAIGPGATLWLIAVGLGLFATNWRAWRAGDPGGDRLLTYARLVGLTGMFFLAGTTFRRQNIRRTRIAGFVVLSAFLLIITTLLFSSLAHQPIATAAFIAASFISSSLWFPAAFRTAQTNDQTVAVDLSGVIALTAVAMFGAYLAEVLSAIPAARSTTTAYAIVTLYELVKLAVVFGFAYFIATRFLARAHGRISRVRTNVGFILISMLFFALISLAAGTIGSMAWAFVAGALWRQTEVGEEFGKRAKPIASALLLSLVFLSLLLQVHGRELSFSRGVIIAAAVAIALKLFSAWFMLRRDSNENRQPLFVSAAMVFPGEVAILFLSLAVSRFVIDGPIFFTILVYAFLSALLIPALLFVANNRRVRVTKQPREPILSVMKETNMLSASQTQSLILEDRSGKAHADSAMDATHLQQIVRDHEVCYEVFPEWSIAEGRQLLSGNEAPTLGTWHPSEHLARRQRRSRRLNL